MNKVVLYEKNDDIALVKLNRPGYLNAINIAVLNELEEIIRNLEQNVDIRAVIIHGEGDSFAAGADIEMMAKMNPVEAKTFSLAGQRVGSMIENLNKIVIAAIRGYALGGGCELALACDIRIGTPDVKIGLPEVTIGMIPGFGGTQRLPRIIGISRAKEIIVTGRKVDAAEAERIGLLNEVVEVEDLMTFSMGMAKKIAANSVSAIGICKQCINEGIEMDISRALSLEAGMFGLNMSNPDSEIGLKAFLNKSKPVFH